MTPALAAVLDWLVCPVCQRHGQEEPLSTDGRSLRCRHGHCLDIARQGHVTMTSAPAGANADTAAMVAARQRVLSAGLFDDLDETLAGILADRQRLAEVGAGTGHHLASVLDHATRDAPDPDRTTPDSTPWGLATDVSVAAVRRAARAHPRMAAVVADTWQALPVATAALDAVLCVFAPRNRDEFARVLRPDGRLVVVTPMPDHLVELRRMTGMIGIQPNKHDALVSALSGRFTMVDTVTVRQHVALDAATAADAVAMGPSAHHVGHVVTGPLEVTSAVEVSVLEPL